MYKLNVGWFWGALLAVAAGCAQGAPGSSSRPLGSQSSQGSGVVTVSTRGSGGAGTPATTPARLRTRGS